MPFLDVTRKEFVLILVTMNMALYVSSRTPNLAVRSVDEFSEAGGEIPIRTGWVMQSSAVIPSKTSGDTISRPQFDTRGW